MELFPIYRICLVEVVVEEEHILHHLLVEQELNQHLTHHLFQIPNFFNMEILEPVVLETLIHLEKVEVVLVLQE